MDNSKPNAFISIPINNPKLCKNIVELQEAMIQHSPILKDYMQKEHSFHITLDVHFISEQDLEKSKLALQALGKEIEKDILQNGPLCITIEGLKTFFNQVTPKVLYACIQRGEGLNRLHNWKRFQRRIFHESHGLKSKAQHNWSPHITIAKMTLKDQHIPVESFNNFKNNNFGVQEIESIELRSMEEDETGEEISLKKFELKHGSRM
ncbi:unnamed protein product [Meganyctiphanes norvegica]|uniref:A-kinase anchor protein 7-like phosphoesterase domain-containing protein n=1 Tax=Meganyctiphanes norvegica TaxID=48144 RepID=A0AAV2SE48_MEGNR